MEMLNLLLIMKLLHIVCTKCIYPHHFNYSLLFILTEDKLSFLLLQAEESFRKIKEIIGNGVYSVVQNSMRNKNVSYYAY